MSNLENLLRRYQEGSLTPDELSELNQLTHRDKVFAAACQQAQGIRRRRRAVVAGVAAVLVVTGAVFYIQSSTDNMLGDSPVVAQADVPRPAEVGLPSVSIPTAPNVVEVVSTSSTNVNHYDTAVLQPKPGLVSPVVVEQPVNVETVVESQEPSVVADDPIVACNTQCSPDSVINDIWKFLRT